MVPVGPIHHPVSALDPAEARGGFLVKEVLRDAREKITATEARQATMRPRAMVLVLFASLFLCLMAGLGLALGWFSLPSLPQ